MVMNSLSRMTMGSVSHIDEAKNNLVRDVPKLSTLGVRLEVSWIVVPWFITTPSHHQ